jgi:hypothetical protein
MSNVPTQDVERTPSERDEGDAVRRQYGEFENVGTYSCWGIKQHTRIVTTGFYVGLGCCARIWPCVREYSKLFLRDRGMKVYDDLQGTVREHSVNIHPTR